MKPWLNATENRTVSACAIDFCVSFNETVAQRHGERDVAGTLSTAEHPASMKPWLNATENERWSATKALHSRGFNETVAQRHGEL